MAQAGTCSAASGSILKNGLNQRMCISCITLIHTCTQAVVRDDGAFLGESLHMGSLLAEEGKRNEQREIPESNIASGRNIIHAA